MVYRNVPPSLKHERWGFQKVAGSRKCYAHEWVNPRRSPQLTALLGDDAQLEEVALEVWSGRVHS